jgi:hypothetical protein
VAEVVDQMEKMEVKQEEDVVVENDVSPTVVPKFETKEMSQ